MAIPNYAYFKGKIVPYSEAKVGVLNHSLNYGTAAFGGLRGYWNAEEQQMFIFRPYPHFERLLNSARVMLLDVEHTPETLIQATLDLVRTENYRQDIYIRPLAYKSTEGIGVKLHGLESDVTIVALPFDKYIQNDTGAHVTISSWRRIDDNAIPARGKISGAYANSALIKTDASRAGFDEALVLTETGHVSEGSAMNVFMVRGGKLITPPVTDNILEGITRRSVMELAQNELGLEVVERSIDRTEVYMCEEFFMTGTAAQITAVTKVDFRPIANGQMGPITSQLRTLYDEMLRGRVAKYRQDWLLPVY